MGSRLEALALEGPNWQTPSYHRGEGKALLDASRGCTGEPADDVSALGMLVPFAAGEEMRTEISTKFARPGLEGIYAEAGLEHHDHRLAGTVVGR